MGSTNKISIVVSSLAKRFGDVRAVELVTFYVQEGELFGFLGFNAAGKTLVKVICARRSYVTQVGSVLKGLRFWSIHLTEMFTESRTFPGTSS